MNYSELFEEITTNGIERALLIDRLKELENDREELCRIYFNSTQFNVDDITNVIVKLINAREKTQYKVLSWADYAISITQGEYVTRGYYVICEEDKYSYYSKKLINERNMHLLHNKDIEVIDRIIYDDEDYEVGYYHKHNISFDFLWTQFDEDAFNADEEELYFCKSDFKKFPYVKDFIFYLFNLQIENNGRQLTREELLVALDEYLKLGKGKKRVRRQ